MLVLLITLEAGRRKTTENERGPSQPASLYAWRDNKYVVLILKLEEEKKTHTTHVQRIATYTQFLQKYQATPSVVIMSLWKAGAFATGSTENEQL